MGVPVSILVGTMTGNAELVANTVRDLLRADGHPTEVLMMDDLKADVFGREGVFLVCSSTYGQGDVPDNARDFYESIEQTKPDLSRVSYGVISLGDSTYIDTYNNGGIQFDKLLSACGATRIGERMEHNASGGSFAEEDAVDWAKGWKTLLPQAVSA